MCIRDRCDTSNSKCKVIWNPYIQGALRLLACRLFVKEDIINVPHLVELYFLNSMFEGDRIDPEPFLVDQV